MTTPTGWIHTAGRADYRGWTLHIVGDQAEMYVGHPLWKCVGFWLMWKFEVAAWKNLTLPICGRVKLFQIVRRT